MRRLLFLAIFILIGGVCIVNYHKFRILSNAYNKRVGRTDVMIEMSRRDLSDINNESICEENLINRDGELTIEGIKALEEYKVDNAVILAAGAATRFVPLSLEQPKGLYKVKGERIIERQIKQLKAAGINDITLVLGYKKEMFFYLKEKYGVEFIFNDEFNTKNNIYSLYLAKEKLKNTYICSSDDYFINNPFQKYEYQPFYAGYYETNKTNEMYVQVDDDNKIISMEKGLNEGDILIGHSFWSKDFSNKFLEYAIADREIGVYDNMFWEWLVKDRLEDLPSFYFKPYQSDQIFEFDYFEQLREFDEQYVDSSHSKIMERIKLVFRCDEEDIVDFRKVSEGMTNTSFIFQIDGVDYIYRYPGEGTEKIISRKNEKKSLQIAKKLGIDPTYIYSDTNEGWKISKLVHSFREPEYSSKEDSSKVIKILRQLHDTKLEVDYGMKPWEDACEMQTLLEKNNPGSFDEFLGLKAKIQKLYQQTKDDSVQKCFCHGDTYKHNWMIKDDGTTLLIDWEYSGMSDPGIDVGYYIVDAMYDFSDAKEFIREYLGTDYSEEKEFHFMAYVAIIAYYWFVWALYRESYGATMGESLFNWYKVAEKYADYLLKGKDERNG